ncbi:Phospholipid/glycerol acyltransferase [Gracilaria domingensis]|nr:Phospholipid/glycerol acyltransferase [Gracilaria domingensis]
MADSMQSVSSDEAQLEQFEQSVPKDKYLSRDGNTSTNSLDNSDHSAADQTSFRPSFKWFDPHHARKAWQKRWDAAPDGWREFVSKPHKVFGLTEEEEEKIRKKNKTYVETPPLTEKARLGTSLIIGFVGTVSKFLMKQLNSLYLYNVEVLHDAIEKRPQSQGLLTFSNHRSVVDDPFLLGSILPPRILLNPNVMRWGLCSLDICFQNALIGRTLRLGKALPIERRGGVSQRFLTTAGEKLVGGDWVHVYPEGRVSQDGMGYAKRGIGKLLAMVYESRRELPLILPLYHQGVENVMPQDEDTHVLKTIVPRTGNKIFVITGEVVDLRHVFEKYMPACAEAGGTKHDREPCLKLYEQVADILGIATRLLRAELRQRVRRDHDIDLGDPYELS